MKTFQFLTKANKWQTIKEDGFQDKAKAGIPVAVLHALKEGTGFQGH